MQTIACHPGRSDSSVGSTPIRFGLVGSQIEGKYWKQRDDSGIYPLQCYGDQKPVCTDTAGRVPFYRGMTYFR